MSPHDLLQDLLPVAVATVWGDVPADFDDRQAWLKEHWQNRPTGKHPPVEGTFSEAILYRAEGKTAAEFALLARTIAALAHQPGGIRFVGLRWDAERGPWPVAA